MQSTAMIALVGVAMAVGYWITPDRVSPLVFTLYWGCVMLVVFWFALLAVADVIATRHHFGRIEQTQLMEKAKLDGQLRKLRAEQGNGRSAGSDEDDRE
jgi:drug/metabolite transporter (DMT)-like permease